MMSNETEVSQVTESLDSSSSAPQIETQGESLSSGSLLDEGFSTESAKESSTEGTPDAAKQDEPKAEEVKKEEEKKVEEPKAKAPEKYENFELPEGMALGEEQAQEFHAVAKELDLTQEQAQKLVSMQSKFAIAHQEHAMAAFRNQVNEWKQESIKSLGPDYKQKLSTAARAIEQFGSPELRKLMADTGLGSHPQMVNFMMRVGKSISEDTFVEGNQRHVKRTAAEILYPTHKR